MTRSITTRLILLLTLSALWIIGVGMLVDYRLSRQEILERVKTESEATIDAAIADMENWLDNVESSTLFLSKILQQRQYSEPELEQLLKSIVAENEDIFGAAIALNPELSNKIEGFAPYYFHRDGEVIHSDLSTGWDQYWQRAWFTRAVDAGAPVWVEPYFDEGGGDVLMTTFSVPVFRPDPSGERMLYAVVTADVALTELHDYLQRLRLGDSGYGILLSRAGTVLSAEDPSAIMRHYLKSATNPQSSETWQALVQSALSGQTLTAELPCRLSEGDCIVRLGTLESTGWPVGIIYPRQEILAPLREFQVKSGAIGLATLLLMTLAVYTVTHRLTRPLTALASASSEIARGQLDAPLPQARGDDEVARLVRSFGAMQQDLKSYIANLETVTASRSRLEGELAAARKIQMSMLPSGGEAHEQSNIYSLWATVRPARVVGGDLYSYARHGDQLFFAVGDVSDKGVPAALFMARAISLIQQVAGAATAPGAAMAQLNNALEQGNQNCMFVTLFLGVLDLRDHQLCFASAGHTAPSLMRNDAVYQLDQETGPALGLATDQTYPQNIVQLLPGDRLAVYTDGIDEAFNELNQMFGVERFNSYLQQSGSAPLLRVGPGLLQAIDTYAGATAQSDDITLLLLQLPRDAGAEDYAGRQVTQSFQRGEQLTTRVLNWLQYHCEGVPLDTSGELALVAEEIVTNIDKYGSLPVTAKIDLTLTVQTASITLEVADGGVEFNPLQNSDQADLGADTSSAEIGGLGVYLITQLTDQQQYKRVDGRNILSVTKFWEIEND